MKIRRVNSIDRIKKSEMKKKKLPVCKRKSEMLKKNITRVDCKEIGALKRKRTNR